MAQRVRCRVVIYADVEIPAADPSVAWSHLSERLQRAVDHELEDQLAGRERDPETDAFLYGMALRLPGDMVITGVQLRPGYDDDDKGFDSRPTLTLLRGGQAEGDSKRS